MTEQSDEVPYQDQKYEYKVVRVNWQLGNMDEWLNKKARGGWKLVEYSPGRNAKMIFEREVED